MMRQVTGLFALAAIAVALPSFLSPGGGDSYPFTSPDGAGHHPVGTAVSPSSPKASSVWKLDKSHSNVKFTVTYMVVSEMDGSFKVFDGTIEHTKEDFSDAKISFSVDVASVNTDNQRRDSHLKGADFFDTEKFPEAKFVSKSFTPAGGNKYKLTGDLTIRDVTKTVTFDVVYGGQVKGNRGMKAGFKATATIDRFDYGLKWSRTLEAGGLSVGKEVNLVLNLQFDQAAQQ